MGNVPLVPSWSESHYGTRSGEVRGVAGPGVECTVTVVSRVGMQSDRQTGYTMHAVWRSR